MEENENLDKLLEILEEEKKKREAKREINAFIEYIMYDAGGYFKQGKIHYEIQKVMNEYQRCVILVPRGHGKTSQIIGRVLWEICRDRNIKIKIICSTDDLAKKRVMAIREYLSRGERLRELYPDIEESGDTKDWSKTSITLKRDIIDKDPTVEAAGILSSGVGGRANLLIFDDVVNFKNSIQQPAMKEAVKRSFREVWLPLLMPGGKIIYIATPWTADDLTAELKTNKSFFVYEKSIDDNFTPLWEEKWSKEELMKKYTEIGAGAFNRAYRLKPLSTTDSTFPLSTLSKVFSPVSIEPKEEWIKVAGVDLGMSDESKTFTVIITVGIDLETKKRYVLNVRRGKWNSPDVAKIIENEYNIYKHNYIFVESNVYQNAIVHWMKSSGSEAVPVVPMETNVSSKYIRIIASSLAVEMNNGLWYIPDKQHDVSCKCIWCSLKKELIEYPFSATNDMVAALCIAARGINEKTAEVEDVEFDSLSNVGNENIKRRWRR